MATIGSQNMFSSLPTETVVEMEDGELQVILETPTPSGKPKTPSKKPKKTKTKDKKKDEVEEITKKLEEFPALGTAPPTKKDLEAKREQERTFRVASSRISELRHTPCRSKEIDLTRTQPCRFVAKKDGAYGCCYREECSFAHSLAELRILPCSYGAKCYRQETDCYFIHPGESQEDFYSRTGKSCPDLPPTSENTRKPKKARQSKADMRKEQIAEVKRIAPLMAPSEVVPVAPSKPRIEVAPDQVQATVTALVASGVTDFELVVKA